VRHAKDPVGAPTGVSVSKDVNNEDVCTEGTRRLDHVFIIPSTYDYPNWGVSSYPEPSVTVEKYQDKDGDCLSDHAALFATINLIETTRKGRWNFKKNHVINYKIASVENLDGDCFLDCDGADFKGDIYNSDNKAVEHKGFDMIPDEDVIYPNWAIETVFLTKWPISSYHTKFVLTEVDDSSPDDHFDINDMPDYKDTSFSFFTQSGEWKLMAGFEEWRSFGNFDRTTSKGAVTTGTDDDESARVFHEMTVEEIDDPTK
jgi:hypothetical protein